jgi:peptide-methionine (R)-S-oxide reductase
LHPRRASPLSRLPLAWPSSASAGEKTTEKFEIEKTPAEWKKQLSPAQYNVLREGTEPLHKPAEQGKAQGDFRLRGLRPALFASETKFESGTGWPSFYQALPNSIVEKSDRTFMMVRTETLCRRCGGHLGHVFDDGPKPTGLRLHERAGADVQAGGRINNLMRGNSCPLAIVPRSFDRGHSFNALILFIKCCWHSVCDLFFDCGRDTWAPAGARIEAGTM